MGTLTVVLVLALFALFRDVAMQGVQVKRNTEDVAALEDRERKASATRGKIESRSEATARTVARIESKLDNMKQATP